MSSIKQLVDRGLALRQQIKIARAELDNIEGKLCDIALFKDHEPLADPDREGRRYLAGGSSDTVPVVFTADKIVGQFKHLSALHSTIKTALGGRLPLSSFFQDQTVWKNRFDDGKKFRAEAEAHLGPGAPAFITACLARDKDGFPRSDTKVMWDDAAPAAQ